MSSTTAHLPPKWLSKSVLLYQSEEKNSSLNSLQPYSSIWLIPRPLEYKDPKTGWPKGYTPTKSDFTGKSFQVWSAALVGEDCGHLHHY